MKVFLTYLYGRKGDSDNFEDIFLWTIWTDAIFLQLLWPGDLSEAEINKSNVYEHDSCTVNEKRKKISTKKKCIVYKLFSISFQFIWRVLPSGSSWNVSRVVSDSLLPHEPAVGCLLSAGARSRLSTQQLPLFHSLSLGSLPDASNAHTSAVLGPAHYRAVRHGRSHVDRTHCPRGSDPLDYIFLVGTWMTEGSGD